MGNQDYVTASFLHHSLWRDKFQGISILVDFQRCVSVTLVTWMQYRLHLARPLKLHAYQSVHALLYLLVSVFYNLFKSQRKIKNKK